MGNIINCRLTHSLSTFHKIYETVDHSVFIKNNDYIVQKV